MGVKQSRELKYVAITAACAFYLDADGVCRRIMLTKKGRTGGGSSKAERCLGAQYVASLDPTTPAQLVALPTPGAPMMFAHVAKNGRVSLVRTGPVEAFEEVAPVEDPAVDTERDDRAPDDEATSERSPNSSTTARHSARSTKRDPVRARREAARSHRASTPGDELDVDLARLAAAQDESEPYVDGADRTLKHSRRTLEAALDAARKLSNAVDEDDDDERTVLRDRSKVKAEMEKMAKEKSSPKGRRAKGVLPKRRR